MIDQIGHPATVVERRKDMALAPGADPAMAGIAPALLEEWALAYLGRYASSAANLRRVLLRRVRRRFPADHEAVRAASPLIDGLVARYCGAGLLDDAAYAAGRARRRLAQGHSPRRIAAGLAAAGIGAAETAAALAGLQEAASDPELAAACAFARRRRLGPYRRRPAIHGEQARELAAFARAGFTRRAAETVLACADVEEAAALLVAEAEQ
jgi:regulatory protein